MHGAGSPRGAVAPWAAAEKERGEGCPIMDATETAHEIGMLIMM